MWSLWSAVVQRYNVGLAIKWTRFRIPLLPFRRLSIFVLSTMPNSLSCVNEDLATDSGGNMNEVFARNYCVARILPREVELVSEWTGLPGGKCVKYFGRSNGLDTELYRNIPFYGNSWLIFSALKIVLLVLVVVMMVMMLMIAVDGWRWW